MEELADLINVKIKVIVIGLIAASLTIEDEDSE